MRPVPTDRVRRLRLVDLLPMCFDIHSELLWLLFATGLYAALDGSPKNSNPKGGTTKTFTGVTATRSAAKSTKENAARISKPPEFVRFCHLSQFSCEQFAASSFSVAAFRANSFIKRDASNLGSTR